MPRLKPPLSFVIAWAAVAVGIGAFGCKRAHPSASATPLSVDVIDCAVVHRSPLGAVCELSERGTIRVVLPPSVSPRATVEVDHALTEIDAAPSKREDGGWLLTIRVPNDADALVIDAVVAGGPSRATVLVSRATARPWLDEARTSRSKGDLDHSAALAEAHVGDADPGARALAKGMLGRIALSRGRADEAFPLLREAIELHRASGRASDVVDDSLALTFALHQRSQRYTEARAVIDGIGPDLDLYPEGRARVPYYRGTLAAETGDHRQALALLREAEHAARRLGMVKLERNTRSVLALELQELGRVRASLPLLADLETEFETAVRERKSDAPSACERAELANNRGWGALLANEAAEAEGLAPTEDARPALEHALGIEGCADAYLRSLALSNLARVALDAGDIASAERRLAEARGAVKEPRGTERLAWIELEGRIARARGRLREALQLFDDGLAHAKASLLRQAEWSLLVARSEVLVEMGRTKDAIASLRAAEDLVETTLLLAPLGEGRATYATSRSRSARMLVGILVREGDASGAAAVAELAHARVLASALGPLRIEQLSQDGRQRWEEAVQAYHRARTALDADAADDWKLPADALARTVRARSNREHELDAALENAMGLLRPPPRELGSAAESHDIELDIFPDLEGFVAIAKRGREAKAYRLPRPGTTRGDELARALFEPIAGFLDGTEADAALVVRPHGAWRAIDVHALPWHGEPLIAKRAVVYSSGLGRAPASASGDDVLVVGDPTSDLPRAFEEARATAGRLGGDGGSSKRVRLLVRDEATRQSLTEGLRGVGHFHYAGHGVFAGDEGWASALPLAAGGRFTVPDILAFGRAPRSIVLSSCEAGKNAGDAEGLGLAQAFIVAGALEVLAPVRRISDDLAAKMANALYEEERASLGRMMRAALDRLRRDDDGSDWAAFRVLVP